MRTVVGNVRTAKRRDEGTHVRSCEELCGEPGESFGEDARGPAMAPIRTGENYEELGVELCEEL